MLKIISTKKTIDCSIHLPYSKSFVNRLQILNFFSSQNTIFNIEGQPNDVKILFHALEKISNNNNLNEICEINIDDCGSAARFLISLLAIKKGLWLLKGSQRMNKRPIIPLVDALKNAGSDIVFINNNDFLPILINGKKFSKNLISIDGSISSQFLSSLLLIAYNFNNLQIKIKGKIISETYILLTEQILKKSNINFSKKNNIYTFQKGTPDISQINIEKDWSSAAFWCVVALLATKSKITFDNLNTHSLQGDKAILSFLHPFGLSFSENNNCLTITNEKPVSLTPSFEINLSNHPDLFPILAVFFAIKNCNIQIYGLDNLNFKESNRIVAVAEVCSFISEIEYTENSFKIIKQKKITPQTIVAKTYNDHRIAMAYALLSYAKMKIVFQDKTVINKSYPTFFDDLKFAADYFEEPK